MNEEKAKHNTLKTYASEQEVAAYKSILSLFNNRPIGDDEILANLPLYMTRSALSRVMFICKLYEKIINTHGVIMEFGTRWGHNLSLFLTLRSIYEPYNTSRKIVGFDTFEGFAKVTHFDGDDNATKVGSYSVTSGYEQYLERLLEAHEKAAPRPNIKKYEIVKGDVIQTLPQYLADNPETIIALAYFDMDLYEPTKSVLEAIKPYLVKNSVIGFDELCLDKYPGETRAFREVKDTLNGSLYRMPYSINQSYLIIE